MVDFWAKEKLELKMELVEGKAAVSVGDSSSKKVKGFYNPEMKLNRDVAVWIVSKLKPDSILDANASTGIRSIRFYLETDCKKITAAEIDKGSFSFLEKNIKANNANVEIFNADANEIMLKNNSDYIDIDPFGSPVPLIKNAIKSVEDNGIIALTATDIGCLSGRFRDACIRKYGSKPMRCMFSNELGVRILIQKAMSEAKAAGKNL